MTVQELALRLLKYIGVTSLDPSAAGNGRNTMGLADGDLDDVAAAINGAMQEIFGQGLPFISQRRWASVLRAPMPITITIAEQYDTACVITGYQPWMLGCTVQINGDPQQNEIVSPTALLRPHAGTGGVMSATVWADALALPPYVVSVIEPVEMPLLPFLQPVSDRFQFRSYNQPFQPTSRRGSQGGNYTRYITANKQVGIPVVYLVESFYDETKTDLPLFLRVNPMPQTAYPITMSVTIKPPTITSQDIDFDNGGSDPLTLLPIEWHESVLLPVAVQRFSTHPAFKGASSPAEMMRQYQMAFKQLKTRRPNVNRETAIYK